MQKIKKAERISQNGDYFEAIGKEELQNLQVTGLFVVMD